MPRFRSAFVGLTSALRAPLWVSGARLRSALESPVSEGRGTGDPDPTLTEALRVANGAVRHLARTRTAWRNTCLYRSAAQYLVLRAFGRSAAIRIGVQGGNHEGEGNVTAHSWVLYHGPERVQDGGDVYEELQFLR